MKTDEELIAEAVAEGRIIKVPTGVSGLPIGYCEDPRTQMRIRQKNLRRANRLRQAEAVARGEYHVAAE